MNAKVSLRLLVATLTAFVCSTPVWAAAEEPVLASGGGVRITALDLAVDMETLPESARKEILADPKKVETVATNLFIRRSLAKRADDAGLAAERSIAVALQQVRDKVLAEVWMAHALAALPPLDDAAIEKSARSAYAAEEKAYTVAEQRRVRHLLVGAGTENGEAKAKELLERLRQGADFAALAKEQSADPASAGKGGDLGFFARGRMIKPFEDAAFALDKPGDLAGPVQTKFGWHLLRLDELRPAGKRPYEEVADTIKRQIKDKLVAERRSEVVTAIREALQLDTAAIAAQVKPRQP